MHLDVVDAVTNRAAGDEHFAARTRRRFGLGLKRGTRQQQWQNLPERDFLWRVHERTSTVTR